MPEASVSVRPVRNSASPGPHGVNRAARLPRPSTRPMGTIAVDNRREIAARTRSSPAPPRSILFTNSRVGTRSRRNARISTRVCGCTPSTAEITNTAPSSTLSARSTSAMKSGWPGVSIRLTVTPSTTKETTADLIVMPRWRSSAMLSVWVVPASTLPISSMTPAANSSRSVSVVLPASTCAKIPRFSVPCKRHTLRMEAFIDGHEHRSHLGSSGTERTWVGASQPRDRPSARPLIGTAGSRGGSRRGRHNDPTVPPAPSGHLG